MPIPFHGQTNYVQLSDNGEVNEKCRPWNHAFDTRAPVGGAVWDGYGTYRRWRPTGGSESLGEGIEGLGL